MRRGTRRRECLVRRRGTCGPRGMCSGARGGRARRRAPSVAPSGWVAGGRARGSRELRWRARACSRTAQPASGDNGENECRGVEKW